MPWTLAGNIRGPQGATGAAGSDPPGTIIQGFWPTAPSGYTFMNTTINRAANPVLFGIFGTRYNLANDAATDFRLPPATGRVLVTLDPFWSDQDQVGDYGGDRFHTLQVSNLPPHTHPLGQNGGNVGFGEAGGPLLYTTSFGNTRANNTLQTGTQTGTVSQAVNHTPPFLVVNTAVRLG
jgi:microcystin-dependent protein